MVKLAWRPIFVICLAACLSSSAFAQEFRGKQIRFWIGGGVGGGLDLYSRALGPFLERVLPGAPTVVMQNLGGNGQQAIQAMNSSAPKDGSVFASVPPGPIQEPMMGSGVASYDLRRFNWIGAPTRQIQICFVLASSTIKSLDDARDRDVTLAVTSPLGSQALVAGLINSMLGTRLKPIAGYAGGGEVMLAIERGEVDGTCSSTSQIRTSRPEWVTSRSLRVLVGTSEVKDPDFPDAPSLGSMLTREEDQKTLTFFQSTDSFLYPLFLPPGTPAPVVGAFRSAFTAVSVDPDYRAAAARLGQSILPVNGDIIEAKMAEMYATPNVIVERVRALTVGK